MASSNIAGMGKGGRLLAPDGYDWAGCVDRGLGLSLGLSIWLFYDSVLGNENTCRTVRSWGMGFMARWINIRCGVN